MIITLQQLVEKIRPERTVLFFGAGASVPSGAPSVNTLVDRMAKAFGVDANGMTLCDLASYIELKTKDRKRLITHLRASFNGKVPTGGLLTVPSFGWKSIYTTNYDNLIEQAYEKKGKSLKKYISNFDFDADEVTTVQRMYKIHGSIETDRCDGGRASLVLTEADYEQAKDFREFLYMRLASDLSDSVLVVIGYSLSDPEIRALVARIAELRAKAYGGGSVLFLMYERNIERAELLGHKNFDVAFGGVDDFFAALLQEPTQVGDAQVCGDNILEFAPALIPITIDARHSASSFAGNPGALFNGNPASFSDVAENLTFRRDVVAQLVSGLNGDGRQIGVILGASGVGKTTAARQTVLDLLTKNGWHAWEHVGDHVFRADYWLAVARKLQELDSAGILVVDDAHQHLQQLSDLIEDLASENLVKLKLLLVSSRGNWHPRAKSPAIFRLGFECRMSKLSGREVDELLNLVDSQPRIAELIEHTFAGFSRIEKKRRLQDRCESETFVCLRNIFASEGFDAIILREYNSLASNIQDIYRFVAFLESSGVRVHRQLVVRLLGIPAEAIGGVLSLLADVISEYEINRNDGVYGWRGRHPVITGIVTKYKFASQIEIKNALTRIVDCINPAFSIEVRSLRELCSVESGIARLANVDDQNVLLRRMISAAPGERVPRHRLIRNLIDAKEFDQAATEIRIFVNDFRKDGPVARYEIDLKVARAVKTSGLTADDRRVMFEDAYALAKNAVVRFPANKGILKSFCKLGLEYFRATGDAGVFDNALDALKAAEQDVGDPELSRLVARYDRVLTAASVEE